MSGFELSGRMEQTPPGDGSIGDMLEDLIALQLLLIESEDVVKRTAKRHPNFRIDMEDLEGRLRGARAVVSVMMGASKHYRNSKT